jgi:hypothetical protein
MADTLDERHLLLCPYRVCLALERGVSVHLDKAVKYLAFIGLQKKFALVRIMIRSLSITPCAFTMSRAVSIYVVARLSTFLSLSGLTDVVSSSTNRDSYIFSLIQQCKSIEASQMALGGYTQCLL